MTGILMLESLTRGNTLKQGDKTPLTYKLLDADGDNMNISGKSATVRLAYPNYLTIGYEKSGLIVSQDDTVTFTIDSVIPARKYNVEIIVDDKFVFPSRSVESKFTIDRSTLGTEANIIEIVGIDAVVRKAKNQIDSELEPFLGDIEQAELDRQAQEEARETAERGREDNELVRTEGAVKLENLVVNGDFSDERTGWNFRRADDITYSNGFVYFNHTHENLTSVPNTDLVLNAGDLLYLKFDVESNSEAIIQALFYDGGSYDNVQYPNLIPLETYPSGVSTISAVGSSTVNNPRLAILYQWSGWETRMGLGNVVAINLTQTFGAGNEPSKEQMDTLMQHIGYFDGETLIPQSTILAMISQKANRKQEEWITPTLLSGATGNIKFRKNEFGKVEFRGHVTGDQNSALFQLPIGYQPFEPFFFNSKTTDFSLLNRSCQITTAGYCFLGEPYGTNELDFNSVSFYAE